MVRCSSHFGELHFDKEDATAVDVGKWGVRVGFLDGGVRGDG